MTFELDHEHKCTCKMIFSNLCAEKSVENQYTRKNNLNLKPTESQIYSKVIVTNCTTQQLASQLSVVALPWDCEDLLQQQLR